MKRRNLMTGITAVLTVGFLSFLAPSSGAGYTASATGTVTITVTIPQPPAEFTPEEEVSVQPLLPEDTSSQLDATDTPEPAAPSESVSEADPAVAPDPMPSESAAPTDSSEQKEALEDAETPEE